MGEDQEIARARVLISGQVQNVYFRISLADRAKARDLKGWVRNCADLKVEAVLEGAQEAIDEVVDWCRIGPPGSRVDAVVVTAEKPKGHRRFRVKG